jgi:hypothetical protein
MAEQSHRDEMNAAIRAQRERQAASRSAGAPPAPAEEPAEARPAGPAAIEPRKGMLGRLRRR